MSAVRFTRGERLAQIKALRAEGLSVKEIAERLELTHSGVRNILNDPDGSKQRARRERYQGRCVDCGDPTDGSSGLENAPLRCYRCARGIERRDVQPDRRRRIPVRLTELDLEIRLAGAREACRWEKGEDERNEILLAAIYPSERVYWVAAERPALVLSEAA